MASAPPGRDAALRAGAPSTSRSIRSAPASALRVGVGDGEARCAARRSRVSPGRPTFSRLGRGSVKPRARSRNSDQRGRHARRCWVRDRQLGAGRQRRPRRSRRRTRPVICARRPPARARQGNRRRPPRRLERRRAAERSRSPIFSDPRPGGRRGGGGAGTGRCRESLSDERGNGDCAPATSQKSGRVPLRRGRGSGRGRRGPARRRGRVWAPRVATGGAAGPFGAGDRYLSQDALDQYPGVGAGRGGESRGPCSVAAGRQTAAPTKGTTGQFQGRRRGIPAEAPMCAPSARRGWEAAERLKPCCRSRLAILATVTKGGERAAGLPIPPPRKVVTLAGEVRAVANGLPGVRGDAPHPGARSGVPAGNRQNVDVARCRDGAKS